MADELTAQQKDDLAKLQDEYSIHDALGAALNGECSECARYEEHGIHWDSCAKRGKIHLGWCSIEAWEKFRSDWLAEFGEDPDWMQTARRKVEDAIRKGAKFRTDITEVVTFKEEAVDAPDPADVPKNTVAWIREKVDGEWILAIARHNTWWFMLATNDRITGSVSPLSAVAEMHVIERPGADPKPEPIKWRREDIFISNPAVRTNPDYALPFSPPLAFADPAYAILKERAENLEKALHYLGRASSQADPAQQALSRDESVLGKDVDEWWREADQHDLARPINQWLRDKGYANHRTTHTSINVHAPWQARTKEPDANWETIDIPISERAGIIESVDSDKK